MKDFFDFLYTFVWLMAFLSALSIPWQFTTWADTERKRLRALQMAAIGLVVFFLMSIFDPR